MNIKRLLCKLFGHKHLEHGTTNNSQYWISYQHCVRCGHDKFADQRFYFSGSYDPTDFSGSGYVDITPEKDTNKN